MVLVMKPAPPEIRGVFCAIAGIPVDKTAASTESTAKAGPFGFEMKLERLGINKPYRVTTRGVSVHGLHFVS